MQDDELPADDPVIEPAEPVAEPAGPADPAPDPTPDPDPKPEPKGKVPAWAEKRFAELTREKNEKAREAEEYKQALEKALAGGPKPEPADPATLSDDEIDRRADQKLAAQQFNQRCNDTYAKGKGAFADFDQAVGNLHLLGTMTPEFLDAVTQLDDAHKLLHHLGSDPDEAARVLALPPIKQAMELTRLAVALDKPKPVSSAPAPIKPLGGKASPEVNLDDPALPMDVWIAERRKQRERNARR